MTMLLAKETIITGYILHQETIKYVLGMWRLYHSMSIFYHSEKLFNTGRIDWKYIL